MNDIRELDCTSSAQTTLFKLNKHGTTYNVHCEESLITIKVSDTGLISSTSLYWKDETLVLTPDQATLSNAPLLCVLIEVCFNQYPHEASFVLKHSLPGNMSVPDALRLSSVGILTKTVQTDDPEVLQSTVSATLFWQYAAQWLTQTRPPFPLSYQFTQQFRHPIRASNPVGTVYQRYIPWLGKTLSFRSMHIEQDLPIFNRWMNDEVVAEFWQEEGDLAKHRDYLEKLRADPRVFCLIGCWDDEPFGYFEVYWAKEDRIAPYYDVADFDRGWHVLVGEAKFRGREFISAWMPSLSHYLFLDDCRTQRIVIEPRADNSKMIRSLAKAGYALLKEFDFPHKRAMLGLLSRERFFDEQRWNPQPSHHM